MKKLLVLLFVFCCTQLTLSAQNTRLWATYFGGSDNDFINCVTTDAAGNVYVTGWTYTLSGIASAGAYQTVSGGDVDAFLAKFDGAGTLKWATYYGGTGGDYGYGVKTDPAGNVYLTGYTYNTNSIASPGAYDVVFSGVTDAFLVKFDANGNRLWGTYYGGTDYDQAYNVATDAAGNVYMVGTTYSTTDIAITGTHQLNNAGFRDAFLVKFNSSGSRIWGTYFGGPDQDDGYDVTVDASGNIIVSGITSSNSGIASGGFQNSFGGNQDAFVAKFNPAGNIIWSTYYGGPGVEYGFGIASGTGGSIFLGGMTDSPSDIASGGYQAAIGGNSDAFLVKFNSAGGRVWGTYYGGANIEEGNDVATDAFGNSFLVGDSYSPNVMNNIATPLGFQNSMIGQENHFLAAFDSAGVRVSATYFGKLHEEEARVTVNPFGDIYLAGTAKSQTGLSYGGAQNIFGGGIYDGLLVKFATSAPHWEIIVPNNNLPPDPVSTGPIVLSGISIFDGSSIQLADAVLKNFSPGTPLPAAGSSTMTFTSDFSGSYSNGGVPLPVSCPATLIVKADFSSATGATRVYDMQMLQLDLSGGSLPPGVKLRISPALASNGQTVITDIGGGQFRMSGFFDVFSELSSDNGNTWQPASAPSRLDFRDSQAASIPTLSEWGLIILGILVLCVGIFFIKFKTA